MGLADSLPGLTGNHHSQSSLCNLGATSGFLSARSPTALPRPSVPFRAITRNHPPNPGLLIQEDVRFPRVELRGGPPPPPPPPRGARQPSPCAASGDGEHEALLCPPAFFLSRRASLSKRSRKCVSAPSRPPGPPRRTRLQPPPSPGAADGPRAPGSLSVDSSGSALTDAVG